MEENETKPTENEERDIDSRDPEDYLHAYCHVDGWQEQLMLESDRYA